MRVSPYLGILIVPKGELELPTVSPPPLKMVSLHISSIPNIFINESKDYGYGVFRMDGEFLQEDTGGPITRGWSSGQS
jgi:hypothetical protein